MTKPPSNNICIMWFRQDLRLQDNPALQFGSLGANGEMATIIPVYIYDTETNNSQGNAETHHQEIGAASKWWLHHSLTALNTSLADKLHVLAGNPLEQLQQIIKKTGATKVVWNRCYEPWQIARDKSIKQTLSDNGVEVKSYNGHLLWEPWQIMNKAGSHYKVFTPFYRKGCLQHSEPRKVISDKPPAISQYQYVDALDTGVDSLNLLPSINWTTAISARWTPGEQGAHKHLQTFVNESVQSYKQARDVPSLNSTSYLSPHLHFGEISPNQAWYKAINAYEEEGRTKDENLDCFLSELGWREFSHYLLYHFPQLPSQNFNAKFDNYPWQNDNALLKRWQKGMTGVPIIDAGMRELWQTGYMHNRVRMIVASYLIKNLHIDWRQGEAWFWDTLLDADLAANSASWQWVAGSGADAAPFFRVFNPVLQGEKFDKNGDYVRKYCPELSAMPNKFLHQPWLADAAILSVAKVHLGKNYPKPLVDLKVSRGEALANYQKIKNYDV